MRKQMGIPTTYAAGFFQEIGDDQAQQLFVWSDGNRCIRGGKSYVLFVHLVFSFCTLASCDLLIFLLFIAQRYT